MPVYNGEKYLVQAIDSILSQTFKDFEFIIIDDGSIDKTADILEHYRRKDVRIKLIFNKVNLGIADALNNGINEAKGKYIIRMDADDISLPERFQKQFDFMEHHPEIDVCGTWYETFGEQSSIVELPTTHDEIRDTLFFHCCVTMIIAKREKFKGILYKKEYLNAEDYELWTRLVENMKFANIPEVTVKYRIHANQIGTAKHFEQNEVTNRIRKRNLEKIGVFLSEYDFTSFCGILDCTYDFKTKKRFVYLIKMLDNIGDSGKGKLGEMFEKIIGKLLLNLADYGVENRITSLMLFPHVFIKWNIFPSNRGKLRYIYHCLKNILHV